MRFSKNEALGHRAGHLSQRGRHRSHPNWLANSRIPTFMDAGHAIAHNKIMIIDQMSSIWPEEQMAWVQNWDDRLNNKGILSTACCGGELTEKESLWLIECSSAAGKGPNWMLAIAQGFEMSGFQHGISKMHDGG